MTGINSVSSGMEGVQGIGPSPGKDSRLKVLEQKLAQVEAELTQKDNDAYRRQNAVYS